MNMIDLNLQTKLLKLKKYLNDISHISYSYAQIGKTFSMSNLDNEKVKQVIKIYEDLLDEVKSLIMNYENENNQNKILE